MRRRVLLGVVVLLIANIALASWYDDYEAGINAVRKGQWQVVIQKMTAALAGNAKWIVTADKFFCEGLEVAVVRKYLAKRGHAVKPLFAG